MKIYLGKSGLNSSWQEPFSETIQCCKCKKEAKIMFVGFEDYPDDKGNFICNLHKTTGKKGSLWLHDAMSCAIYLCPFCFEATAIVNQA